MTSSSSPSSSARGTPQPQCHGTPRLLQTTSCQLGLGRLGVRGWWQRNKDTSSEPWEEPLAWGGILLGQLSWLHAQKAGKQLHHSLWGSSAFLSLFCSGILVAPSIAHSVTCCRGDKKQSSSVKVGSDAGFNESSQGYLALTNQ